MLQLPDSSLENHYILVIHGTYDSPPEEGSPAPVPWYFVEKVPGNFCNTLASQLEESVLGRDAIWRKLPGTCPNLRVAPDAAKPVPAIPLIPLIHPHNLTTVAQGGAGTR